VNQAGSRSMRLVAERASDGAVAVELAVQILIDAVPVLEISIAGVAVEVLLDLVAA